jgi:hypothetical protein
MKRWFGHLAKDSVKAKIGLAVLLFAVGVGISAAAHRPAEHNIQVAESSVTTNAPADTVNVSEKPKIAVTETKVETTEEDVPFSTTQTYDGTLPKDTEVVRVEGANGKKVVKTEVKTKDGVEVSRELISENITVPPVAKVIAIGTKVVAKAGNNSSSNCDTHYSPCVKKIGGDIDCKDIGHQVKLIDPAIDPYNLDRDGNGTGCDNYPSL